MKNTVHFFDQFFLLNSILGSEHNYSRKIATGEVKGHPDYHLQHSESFYAKEQSVVMLVTQILVAPREIYKSPWNMTLTLSLPKPAEQKFYFCPIPGGWFYFLSSLFSFSKKRFWPKKIHPTVPMIVNPEWITEKLSFDHCLPIA